MRDRRAWNFLLVRLLIKAIPCCSLDKTKISRLIKALVLGHTVCLMLSNEWNSFLQLQTKQTNKHLNANIDNDSNVNL